MPETLLVGVLLAALFCWAAVYLRWLSMGGAFAAMVIGMIVWVSGGWKLAMPLIVFFISGSFLSRFQTNNASTDKKHKKPRDHIQVLCNGGVAAGCLLGFVARNDEVFLTAYFLSIAVSTADTWSSEIGMLKGGTVVDILNFRPIQKGMSGGVTALGSLAGCLGGCLMALLFLWIYQGSFFETIIIAVGGVAGMLLDSLFGSLLQARYKLPGGRLVEYYDKGQRAILVKGFPWMTNDLVNFLSNILITVAGLALLHR